MLPFPQVSLKNSWTGSGSSYGFQALCLRVGSEERCWGKFLLLFAFCLFIIFSSWRFWGIVRTRGRELLPLFHGVTAWKPLQVHSSSFLLAVNHCCRIFISEMSQNQGSSLTSWKPGPRVRSNNQDNVTMASGCFPGVFMWVLGIQTQATRPVASTLPTEPSCPRPQTFNLLPARVIRGFVCVCVYIFKTQLNQLSSMPSFLRSYIGNGC